MGSVLKYAAVYPSAWWRAAGLSGTTVSDGNVLLTADSSPPRRQAGQITGFVIGPAATRFAEQPVDVRKQLVVSDLVAYFGEEGQRHPTEFVELNWPG